MEECGAILGCRERQGVDSNEYELSEQQQQKQQHLLFESSMHAQFLQAGPIRRVGGPPALHFLMQQGKHLSQLFLVRRVCRKVDILVVVECCKTISYNHAW